MEEREFKYSGAANIDEIDGTVDAGWADETIDELESLVRELHEEGEISDRARDELINCLS